MKKTKSIKRTRNVTFTYTLTPEEQAWESKTYRDYRYIYNGRVVRVSPNIENYTYGRLALIPVKENFGGISFRFLVEPDDCPTTEEELQLIKEYLANDKSIITETPMPDGKWNVIDTRQLNREKKLSFILG